MDSSQTIVFRKVIGGLFGEDDTKNRSLQIADGILSSVREGLQHRVTTALGSPTQRKVFPLHKILKGGSAVFLGVA